MKLMVFPMAIVVLTACSSAPPQQVSRSPLDAETLALSCSELGTRNARIASRLREMEAESKARARQTAVTDAAVNVGLGALIGVGARGGLSGLRAASATVQGVEAVRSAERGTGSMQDVTDTLALAGRSSELQRAMIEKGCAV